MSYAELDRRAASTGRLIFGWANIVAIPLQALGGFMLLALLVAFCDAPEGCGYTGSYLVLAIVVPAILWVWLLIALIRRRHLVVPLVLAGLGDLLAISVAMFILINALAA